MNKEMKNPSPMMRPAPFWSWNDNLDKEECRRQIREMAQKGWGSFFMHSRVGLCTPYLSEEWMDLCNACADEAEKQGLYAWLYDEDKWPSGFGGGVVSQSPEYRAKELILLNPDNLTEDDTVMKKYSFGGAEYVICRRVEPLGNMWFNFAAYTDLMSPKAVRYFLDTTHEKYKEACGDKFGKSIPGCFTDEPCYLFYGHDGQYRTPWSDYLSEYFEKMNGYKVEDHLEKLFFDVEDYTKIRFDYYNACTNLFKESWTKQYYDWCVSNNLKLVGHFMAEDSCWYQTQWVGDVMSQYEYMSWPGTDKLCRHIEQNVTNKQASTVADQLNKERAFSEVFGCEGGQVSFFERKWIGDWQTVLGINFVNHHLSLYSMRGERKRDYPANLFYQQPWWDEEKYISDYFGRINAFGSEGKRDVSILMLQPLTTAWCIYSPLHMDTGDWNMSCPQEKVYDIPFDQASKRFMEEKLDYHYGNEEIMKKYAKVVGDKIVINDYAYSVFFVPPCENLRKSTYELMKEFSDNGGKLIFTKSLPTMIDGVPAEISFDNYEVGIDLEKAIKLVKKSYKPDIKIEDRALFAQDKEDFNCADLWCHARETEGSKRYFISNTNEKRIIDARITIDTDKPVAIFDAFDGSLYKFEGNVIDCTFAKAGSIMIIVGEEAKEAEDELVPSLGSGVVFADLDKMFPVAAIDKFDVEVLDKNTLLLNDVKLKMGDKVYEGPVCGSWFTMFYNAEEGTPYIAEYRFESLCEVENATLAMEVAENNDEIYFNGEKVIPLKARGEMGAFDTEKSYLDVNFTKVPLPKIKEGINTIVFTGKKINNICGPGFHTKVETPMSEYCPTEVEEAYIVGDFS
ncbi:MAG: glycoside hydrolase, partial [Armatimonadetes bacterium]|nr:glycoside hydrolase [Candidatus Hippobium faecium]